MNMNHNILPPHDTTEPKAVVRHIPKANGKTREVWIPSQEVSDAHHAALGVFQRMRIPMPYAYGGVPGKNLLKHIQPHKAHDTFMMLDIVDAYGSVKEDSLKRRVRQAAFRYAKDPQQIEFIESFMEEYAFLPDVKGLPQGFPASPFLFNLYCQDMDTEIADYLEYEQAYYNKKTEGLSAYTRWLDDLTISVGREFYGGLSDEVRSDIREIVEKYGFTIHHRKSRNHTLNKGPVTITGLSIYPGPNQKSPDESERVQGRRIAPAPHLLELTKQVIDETFNRINNGEARRADRDIIAGYYGVLSLGGKPEKSRSKTVRNLAERCRVLMEILR